MYLIDLNYKISKALRSRCVGGYQEVIDFMRDYFEQNREDEKTYQISINSVDNIIPLFTYIITNCRWITRVVLFKCNLRSPGVDCIVRAMHICKLEEINIAKNDISFVGAKALGKALENDVNLKKLVLSSNPLGDLGASNIAEGLKQNTVLTELELGNTKIRDRGGASLAELLQCNTVLTTLLLDDNAIGDNSAIAFASALQSKTNIFRLALDYNDIDNRGAEALLDVLGTRSETLTINLDFNRFSIVDGEPSEVGEPSLSFSTPHSPLLSNLLIVNLFNQLYSSNKGLSKPYTVPIGFADVPPDGHCFYSAVAAQLAINNCGIVDPHQVFERAIDHIISNPQIYSSFLSGSDIKEVQQKLQDGGDYEGALEAYLNYQLQHLDGEENVWADNFMIVATVNAIGLAIDVSLYNLDGTQQIGQDGNLVVLHFTPDDLHDDNGVILDLCSIGNIHFGYACYDDQDISSRVSSTGPSPALSYQEDEVNATVLGQAITIITPVAAFLA